jgi:hypothetical protein
LFAYGQLWTMIFLPQPSHVAGLTGMYNHAWLVLSDGVLPGLTSNRDVCISTSEVAGITLAGFSGL